jgi:DNA polymerase III subunit gamma/tau
VSERIRAPTGYKYLILFFDEAHALSPLASDALLKKIEEAEEGFVFIFATTEVEKIRPAMQSRLAPLPIKPLPVRIAIGFLKTIAEKEGISCEPAALALLAHLRHGYPRDLLIGLELLHEAEAAPITVERVRVVFDVAHTAVLVDYFLALGAGDFVRQTEIMESWQEPIAEKVRWIQAFLVSLYYNDLVGAPAIIDGLTHSIPTRDRTPILDAFCRRLGFQAYSELAPAWRAMMWFWPVLTREPDEAALHLRLTLFHDTINRELARMAGQAEASPTEAGRTSDTAPAIVAVAGTGFPHRAHALGKGSGLVNPAYPSREDVREIVNRSSFLVQDHGVMFNARLKIRPTLFGVHGETDEISFILSFLDEFEGEVQRCTDRVVAHLTMLDRDENGVVGRMVAHLPRPSGEHGVDCARELEKWLRDWRLGQRSCIAPAIAFGAAPADDSGDVKFHWDAVLDLCAGLDESVTDWDPETLEERPIVDLLQMPKRSQRQPAPIHFRPVGDRLFVASTLLEATAIVTASSNRLEPLSAFDARAWKWIRTGWERQEYRDRRHTRLQRDEALAEILQMYGTDTDEARVEVDRLVSSWPKVPEQRQRSWRGWWRRAQV